MQRKTLTGTIPAAAAALLLSLVLNAGCGRKSATSKAAEEAEVPAVLVNPQDVVRVDQRRLEAGISFSGDLTPQHVTDVTARFEGDLEEVTAREGERVRKGQSLAVYKPQDVEDAAAAAEADLLAARSALVAARNAEARAKKLLDAGAAAPSDLEAAQATRAAAEARVQAAEAVRNHASENAERLDVPSPIDGWVSSVIVHAGSRTAVGDRLLTVVNTDTLELSGTIPSEALARVQPGTPISFRVGAYPNEVFTGRVDRVSPTTEPGTRQIRIHTRIPNPDGKLVGGLYAGGRVIYSSKDQALAAPVGVIRKEGTEQVVYRLRGGRATRLPVTAGLTDDEAGVVELLGPVSAGDSLLTGVLPGIRDGAAVRVLAGAEEADSGSGAVPPGPAGEAIPGGTGGREASTVPDHGDDHAGNR
jgi:membrane fusion protein (multidrug efflux system)